MENKQPQAPVGACTVSESINYQNSFSVLIKMSSVVLMVGQCGNQIGHDLMKLIDSNTDTHPLTHRDGKVRCVCIDSEPKVINANIADDTRRGQFYRGSNVVVGQCGRGNNWALGYYGLGQETRETSLLYRSMDALRKEVERCDRFAGIHIYI